MIIEKGDRVEMGYVQWVHRSKNYGFIASENTARRGLGVNFFFHINDLRHIRDGKNGPVFGQEFCGPGALPRENDAVYFIPGWRPSGPAVKCWGYGREHDRATWEVDRRGNFSCGLGMDFVFLALDESVFADPIISECGTVSMLRRDYKDTAMYTKYLRHSRLAEKRGYSYTDIDGKLYRVVPYSGSERKLARAFRYYSSPYGEQWIVPLSVPAPYFFKGMLLEEFLQFMPSLNLAETRLFLRQQPVYVYRHEFDVWSRFLHIGDANFGPFVELALTVNSGKREHWVDLVQRMRIFRHHRPLRETDGVYTSIPESTQEEMAEMLGGQVADRLLTGDILSEVTVEQIKAATDRNPSGSGVSLDEILKS